jgi:Molybdopterin oxidoreductase
MSETAKFANVVLPGASFFEKSGTFTIGGRRVQRVNEVIPPLAGTKTESAAPSGRCRSPWPPGRAEPGGARRSKGGAFAQKAAPEGAGKPPGVRAELRGNGNGA